MDLNDAQFPQKRGSDWQVGPVLKNKADSQGTLFRGGTKYSSDQRYPRGYTPERLHEVAEAVGGNYTRGQGAKAGYYRDHPYGRYDESGEFQVTGRADNRPKRGLVDNIARSTVPAEHLQGKPDSGRHLAFWVNKSFDPRMAEAGTAGTYESEPRQHSNRHDLYVHTDHVDSTTPIHEIGHHVSNLLGNEHSHYNSPESRGAEEGFADRYAYEHYRTRKGKRLDSLRVYPPNEQQTEGRHEEFESGYHATRGDIPKPDLGASVSARRPKSITTHSPTFTADHDHGQMGLFSIGVEHRPDFTPEGHWNTEPETVHWRKARWQDEHQGDL